jgi:hypothetical protein
MADAQVEHDDQLLQDPDVRASARRAFQQRARESRMRGDWRSHLEAHREELLRLKVELERVRDEVKAQARRPVDAAKAESKAAKADIKAQVRRPLDEVKAEVKAAKADIKAQVKGRSRRPR